MYMTPLVPGVQWTTATNEAMIDGARYTRPLCANATKTSMNVLCAQVLRSVVSIVQADVIPTAVSQVRRSLSNKARQQRQ